MNVEILLFTMMVITHKNKMEDNTNAVIKTMEIVKQYKKLTAVDNLI